MQICREKFPMASNELQLNFTNFTLSLAKFKWRNIWRCLMHSGCFIENGSTNKILFILQINILSHSHCLLIHHDLIEDDFHILCTSSCTSCWQHNNYVDQLFFLERLKVGWSQVFLIFLFLRHTLKMVLFVNDQMHPGSQLAKAEVRYLLLFCPSVQTPGINKKMCILAHIFRDINSVSVGSVL